MTDDIYDSTAKTFRTQNGTCTVTPSEIRITRLDKQGNPVVRRGNPVMKMILIYGGLGAVAVTFGVRFIREENLGAGIPLVLLGLLLLTIAYRSRSLSAAPVVQRSAITRFVVHPPGAAMPRGYFSIFFNEGMHVKKRMVILRKTTEGGDADFIAAAKIFSDEGLITEVESAGTAPVVTTIPASDATASIGVGSDEGPTSAA